MTKEETLKRELWAVIISSLIVIAGIILLYYLKIYLPEKRIQFISGHLKGARNSRRYAEQILKWSNYYDNDWLKSWAICWTETRGDVKAIGKKREKGLYQIMPSTKQHVIETVKPLTKSRDLCGEMGIIIGNLHYRGMKLYWKGDWMKAVECYNVGLAGYRANRRNSKYLEKYIHSYIFMKREWKKYRSLL